MIPEFPYFFGYMLYSVPMVTKRNQNKQFLLGFILSVSVILRIGLVLNGGQFFFPDEERYNIAREVIHLFENDLKTDALATLLQDADHLGFKILGLLPAFVEFHFGENVQIPGLFFSFFSIVNVYLFYLIANQFDRENHLALIATFLLAISNSFFYFGGHLLPYDAALTFGLCGLFFAVRTPSLASNQSSGRSTKWFTPLFNWLKIDIHMRFRIRTIFSQWMNSTLAGFCTFLTFFTYNGYWTLAGLVLFIHYLPFWDPDRKFLTKFLVSILAVILPFIGLFWIDGVFGQDLLQNYQSFSKTIHQGAFSEGGIMPLKYLWASEGFNIIIWAGLIGFAISQKNIYHHKPFQFGLVGILIVFGSLLIFSVFLQKFVVYGRLVRQIIPFITMIAAQGLALIGEKGRSGKVLQLSLIVAMIFIAGFNFKKPLTLTFPLDFAKNVQTQYPEIRIKPYQISYEAPDIISIDKYQVTFIKYIFPAPNNHPEIQGQVLIQAEHPQKYLPFLFEGISPENRVRFLTTDISMKLIKVSE